MERKRSPMSERERVNRLRKGREERKARAKDGLCTWCDEAKAQESPYCVRHRDYMIETLKRYRDDVKAGKRQPKRRLNADGSYELHQRVPVKVQLVPLPDCPRGHGQMILDDSETAQPDMAKCLICGRRAFSGPAVSRMDIEEVVNA